MSAQPSPHRTARQPRALSAMRARLLAAPALFLLLGAQALTSESAGKPKPGTVSPRSYDIPGRGKIELQVPREWQQRVSRPAGESPPTIEFGPKDGKDFKVVVTVFWHPKGKAGYNAPGVLRAEVESAGHEALTMAAEKKLVLEGVRGKEARGYFFAPLTDKNLVGKPVQPDDYPHFSHGAVAVGDLTIVATVFFQKPGTAVHRAVLEMAKSATRSPKTPAAKPPA